MKNKNKSKLNKNNQINTVVIIANKILTKITNSLINSKINKNLKVKKINRHRFKKIVNRINNKMKCL